MTKATLPHPVSLFPLIRAASTSLPGTNRFGPRPLEQ